MGSQNTVITLDSPIGPGALGEMNSGDWTLLQVVTEKFEVGRDHTDHCKIFYGYRYHHYFSKV